MTYRCCSFGCRPDFGPGIGVPLFVVMSARVRRLVRMVCVVGCVVVGGAACGASKYSTGVGQSAAGADIAVSTTALADDAVAISAATAGSAASAAPVAGGVGVSTSTMPVDNAAVESTSPTLSPLTEATVVPVVPVAPLLTPVGAPPDDGSVDPVVVLGTIEIPKIGISESLYEGIRLTTFDRGPGHWPGTAMPGQFGNAVVGGHRTSHTRPFRHLDALVPGDEVVFTTADGRFVYRVVSTEVVTPDVTRVVNQNPGFTATLFACHPLGSTRERIVVHLILSTP